MRFLTPLRQAYKVTYLTYPRRNSLNYASAAAVGWDQLHTHCYGSKSSGNSKFYKNRKITKKSKRDLSKYKLGSTFKRRSSRSSSNITPVAVITNADHSQKIALIPINLFEGKRNDDEAFEEALAIVSLLRDNGRQVELFADNCSKLKSVDRRSESENRNHKVIRQPSEKARILTEFEGHDEAAFLIKENKSVASDQVPPVPEISFTTEDDNLPAKIASELREIPVSGMQLNFEMNMTNVKDALLNPSNLPALPTKTRSLENSTLAMSTNVRLDSVDTKTIPLHFNALIQGIVEVNPKEFSNDKLKMLKVPQFNEYVTAIAANICSTALQKGFPTDVCRKFYSTKKTFDPFKNNNVTVKNMLERYDQFRNELNARKAHITKKTNDNGNTFKGKQQANEEEEIQSKFTSAQGLLDCKLYQKSLEVAARKRKETSKSSSVEKVFSSSKQVEKASKFKQADLSASKYGSKLKTKELPEKPLPALKYGSKFESKCGKSSAANGKANRGSQKVNSPTKCGPKSKLKSKSAPKEVPSKTSSAKASSRSKTCQERKNSSGKPTSCASKTISKKSESPCKKASSGSFSGPKSKDTGTSKKAPLVSTSGSVAKGPCKKNSSVSTSASKSESRSPCKKASSDSVSKSPCRPCKQASLASKPSSKSKTMSPCKTASTTKSQSPCKKASSSSITGSKSEGMSPCKKTKSASKFEAMSPCKKASTSISQSKGPCKKTSASKSEELSPCKRASATKSKGESPCKKASSTSMSGLKSEGRSPCKKSSSASKSEAMSPCKKASASKSLGESECKKASAASKSQEDSPCKRPSSASISGSTSEIMSPCTKSSSKSGINPKDSSPCKKASLASASKQEAKDPCQKTSSASICGTKSKPKDPCKKSSPDSKSDTKSQIKCGRSAVGDTGPKCKKSSSDSKCGSVKPDLKDLCKTASSSSKCDSKKDIQTSKNSPSPESQKACKRAAKAKCGSHKNPANDTSSSTSKPQAKAKPLHRSTKPKCSDYRCPSCNTKRDVHTLTTLMPPFVVKVDRSTRNFSDKCPDDPKKSHLPESPRSNEYRRETCDKLSWQGTKPRKQRRNRPKNCYPEETQEFCPDTACYKVYDKHKKKGSKKPKENEMGNERVLCTAAKYNCPLLMSARQRCHLSTNARLNQEALIEAPYKICIRNQSIPRIFDNDILVSVDSVALSDSDIYMFETGAKQYKEVTLGNEAAGVVQKIGRNVHHVKIGDHVAIESAIPCRRCDLCKNGHYNLCSRMTFNGCLSKYCIHPGAFCHKISKEIPMERAAMVYQLALGCNASNQAGMKPNSNVAIIGSCAMTVCAAIYAQSMGVANICVMCGLPNTEDIVEEFVTKKVGCFDTKVNERALVEKILGSLGTFPDIVINCSSCTKTMNAAIMALKPTGTCVIAGFHSECASFNIMDALMKEIRIMPSYRSRNMFPLANNLLETGRAPIDGLIANCCRWDELEAGFRAALLEGNSGPRKVIVQCQAGDGKVKTC